MQNSTVDAIIVYPNPTKDIVYIDLVTPAATSVSIKVNDLSGRLVKQIQVSANEGSNHFTLSMGEFASGVYTVQVFNQHQLTYTGRLIKE